MRDSKNKKPFKTHNQQMRILRDRELIVPSESKRSLEEHGYYSLINGYKELFLRKHNGEAVSPEKYLENASFKEIKSLYDFDKKLRHILFTPLMEYESNLGSEISYRFSEKYSEPHAYLAIGNYTNDEDKANTIVKTISNLSNEISRKTQRHKNTKNKRTNAIDHYVNEYKHVPLWVLVNYLTFGELNYFYKSCTDDVKKDIALDFSTKYKRNYKTKIKIHTESIETLNQLVNYFRNSVAHGERTYDKIIFKSKEFKSIKQDLGITNFDSKSQCGVFELIVALKLVLCKKEYHDLVKQIYDLFDKYGKSFKSVEFKEILDAMHFPDNYREILKVK